MKKVELIIIKADNIDKYYIANIQFLPKKRGIKFILASNDKNLPELTMFIKYINLPPNQNLFMIAEVGTKKLGFLVSAVTEAELGNIGKAITKSLYDLLLQKGSIDREKETHTFAGYRSELGGTV